jgi:DNA-binding CsgD family transcriptional regulator
MIPRSYEIITRDASSDPVAIDYVAVNGQIYDDNNDLRFQPSQNDLSIQLKDFSFRNYHIPLRYKLENWDDQWHDIPPDGQLDFINLDDGKYDLYLSDNKGTPSMLLTFTIKPHWYESWPGGLLFLALLFLLLWYLNKREERTLTLQTEKLQKEKERELESERIKAKNEKLEREIIYKSKMLANSTMALVQKNKMLNELKTVIAKDVLNDSNNRHQKQRIVSLIDRNLQDDSDWEIFEKNFAEVHEDFLEKLKEKYPDITAGELKLAAYIRMNLSSKEIAPLLNISIRSVENKRYRLRKKMGIGHECNLSDHLLRL